MKNPTPITGGELAITGRSALTRTLDRIYYRITGKHGKRGQR